MFTCSRCVDKCCTNDDLPPPGIALAEAVQLTRSDPANIKRLVSGAVKKLSSSQVTIRVKALRLLQHLAQNGPAGVTAEIKLNTTAISDCISWRGAPSATRGYEPYQEMKDAAQSLLDMSFAAQQATAQSFAVTNTGASGIGAPRFAGVSTMESYGSGEYVTQSASLEPRNLDPNHRDVVEEVTGFFKKAFKIGPKAPTHSTYGSASNVPGSSQMATYQAYNPYPPGPMGMPEQPPEPAPMPVGPPPPQMSQFKRLEADISWNKKKPANPIAEKPKPAADTPTSKFLKVTGGRALPTNSEINSFKAALTPESLAELKAGVVNTDWKVKVRAIAGLECYGEKYGLGPVADVKDAVEKCKGAPQASLRGAATRFFEAIKDVEPSAAPETPSAFDFVGEQGDAEEVAQDETGFTFGA